MRISGLTLCIVTLRDRLLSKTSIAPNDVMRSWAPVLVPAVILPLPHYLLSRGEIVYYLTTNSLGPHREYWKLHADWATHLAYFSTGLGGQVMLGRHLYIMAAVLLTGAAGLFTRGRREHVLGLCFCLVTLAAYLGPSSNTVKTQFLATPFDFLLIFATLATLRAMLLGLIFQRARGGWSRLALVFVLLNGAYAFRWPPNLGYRTDPLVKIRHRCVDTLYGSLPPEPGPAGTPKVFIAVFGPCVNSDLFGYLSAKDALAGLPGFEFTSDAITPDAQSVARFPSTKPTLWLSATPGIPKTTPPSPAFASCRKCSPSCVPAPSTA